MSDDRNTIHMFWHGGELPPLARACVHSFLARGHQLRVHAYEPIALPSGAVLEDAREIVALDDPLHPLAAPRTITAFADVFRYRLLYRRGGWWMDTDVYCLTDELPAQSHAWAEQEPGLINNAILKFPKGDPLCGRLAELARERATPAMRWGTVGPNLVTEVLAVHDDLEHAGSCAAFYPVHWLEAHMLWLPEFQPEVARRTANAQFVHCWAQALENMGIEGRCRPPSGSALADMMEPVPGTSASTPWQRWQTRRAIHRFLRQRWVKEYWVTRVGRSWAEHPRTRRLGVELGF